MNHNPEELKTYVLIAMNKIILDSHKKGYPINHVLQCVASVCGACITRAPTPQGQKAALYEAIEEGFLSPTNYTYDRKSHDLN